MYRTRLAAIALIVLASLISANAQQSGYAAIVATPPLETYLELLRQQAGIPGLSAAIVQNGEVAWERGFGFQNLENRARATPDTPYLVGDLSSTMAATLLLQCVEQRHLDLDAPVRGYNVTVAESDASLRQLLSHSSAANPGEGFRYDPDRFGLLSAAVEFCAPQPYQKSVAHRILERLAMKDSVPGREFQTALAFQEGLFDSAALERYARILERLAVPYRVDKNRRAVRGELPAETRLTASTGVVSTVRDLARFDAALDAAILLRPETLAVAWTNASNRERMPHPMGLGWFVQKYGDEPVVWHFGLLPNAYSSLIVKLPARNLTLILLANSDGLSAPFQLASGDVTRSLFATLFLRLFAQ
jgi:CubicO group peptidase (beta-lactamase class C family)